MSALILAVVLWVASVIVGLGAVYAVVVLIVRSVVPRNRSREAQSALTRPADGAIDGLDRQTRGGREDPTDG
jgi:hypothetical protein